MNKSCKMLEKNLKRYERVSIISVILGIVIIGGAIGFFVWKETFDRSQEIDAAKIGQFGDFIGGAVGSMWALAGVLLFYVALKEQRKDFKTNREALELQTKELKNQIHEMEETRKVYEVQSQILKQQQFETTFFNLLNQHQQLVNTVDLEVQRAPNSVRDVDKILKNGPEYYTKTGRDCFYTFFNKFREIHKKKIKNTGLYIEPDKS